MKLPVALLALITPDGRTDPEDALPPIPRTHVNPKIVGAKIVNRTLLASTCDRARTMWMLGTGAETVTTANTNLGLEALPIRGTDEEKHCVVPLTQRFFLSAEQRTARQTPRSDDCGKIS